MLRVEHLYKNFSSFSLEDISFTVEKGDYFVILGESGAGKSLLLEMIAGLSIPDKGKIILENENISRKKIQKRQIGLVFQDLAVFPHLSVFDNIAFALRKKRMSRYELRRKVIELANNMDITHLLRRKPGTLSGGELQRIALARTLALKPKCLLLDEPLASVDVQLKSDIRNLLRTINRQGNTIVHVTHDYEEAVALASTVAVIHRGKIVQTGTPEEIFTAPKSPFVAKFIGEDNFFRAKLMPDNGNGVKTALLNQKLEINLSGNYATNEGYVMIRSKDIILSEKRIESSALNSIKGVIADWFPEKYGCKVMVEAGVKLAVLITRRSQKKLDIDLGKEIWVSFKASAVRFFSL